VLKTKDPLVGESHRIDGTIVNASDGSVRLATDTEEVEVPYDAIKSARTVFE
jgi:ribosome maturation factor RimP